MKVIDLLNKIAKGEEVPKKIKYECDTYVTREDPCNKDVKYKNEKKDVDGYSKYLFQDWIIDAILNNEIEIIEEVEDKEYEDIEEFKEYKLINTRDILELEMIINKINADYNYKINALIRNQKYILERMKRDE